MGPNNYGPRLEGIVLRTTNKPGLKEFYQKVFGMTFTEHTDHGPAHSAASLGNSPDSLIEIYNRRPEELDSPLVVVGNLEETLTRVDSTNIVRQPYETSVGKMAIISDPDGRKIILREETN